MTSYFLFTVPVYEEEHRVLSDNWSYPEGEGEDPTTPTPPTLRTVDLTKSPPKYTEKDNPPKVGDPNQQRFRGLVKFLKI